MLVTLRGQMVYRDIFDKFPLFTLLTLYILTSVCIFSILFSIHYLGS